MGKQKSPNPTSPQVVATLSSLLLLLVSAALGFYFMELRGPGIRTLLSGSHASEVFVLLGGLAAVVLTGHLAVGNAARSTQGTGAYRKLLRRLAEVDHSDPHVLEQFDAVPEVRELAAILVAEKHQGQQLQDALESVRGESRGLLDGMERCLKDLGKMREDHPSELGRKVSTLWNSMIERVHELDALSKKAATTTHETPVPASTSFVAGGDVAMEERLRELEQRVAQLQSSLGTTASEFLVTEDDTQQGVDSSLLLSEPTPEVVDLEDDTDPISPLVLPEDAEAEILEEDSIVTDVVRPVVGAEELKGIGDVDPVEEGVENTFAEARPNRAPTFAGPWQEQVEEEPQRPKAAAVPEVAGEDESAQDAERTYSEWGGAGLAALTPGSQDDAAGFGSAPGGAGSPEKSTTGDVGFGAPVTPDAPAPSHSFSFNPPKVPRGGQPAEASRMQFPEFAARRRADTSDHVEVTYDGSTHLESQGGFSSFDSRAEDAFLEEVPVHEIDDDVVDLKSLGALETNE